MWNDHGELILGRLTPKGFDQVCKAKLLETSENTRGRDIIWCYPAYANRRLYVHNGKEIICVDLAAPPPRLSLSPQLKWCGRRKARLSFASPNPPS